MIKPGGMRALVIVTMASLAARAAAADLRDDAARSGTDISLRAPSVSLSIQPEPDPAAAPKIEPRDQATHPRFGAEQSVWITTGLGVAYDFKQATDYNLRVAYSIFLVENVEFSAELNAWYFAQPGDNQFGINPAMDFRWHFVNTGPWSVFAELGIGVLVATGDVPAGGTSFDFTPTIGVGFTREISDSGARLQAGLRWHHISNGRLDGDARNPSRDAPMLYAGIQLPF